MQAILLKKNKILISASSTSLEIYKPRVSEKKNRDEEWDTDHEIDKKGVRDTKLLYFILLIQMNTANYFTLIIEN